MTQAEELQQLVSDEAIKDAWGNANFGPRLTPREIIRNTLLKCASGYRTGFTARSIAIELGLITKAYNLTKLGRQYLYVAYCDNTCL